MNLWLTNKHRSKKNDVWKYVIEMMKNWKQIMIEIHRVPTGFLIDF